MEENAENVSDVVFSSIMEEIFSSCVSKQDEDTVPVSTLVEYMRPHMLHYPTGISDIQALLDPNNENPSISKEVFYEAMQKWIGMIKEYESNSVRSSDSGRKCFPFSQSTPTQSSSEESISNILNISTVSPTSFDGDKSNSSVERDMQLLKQQLKTLNIAHSSTLNELSTVKHQLVNSEQLIVSLREDLDRTSRRLSHEQQLNAELQKYLENKDDSREENNDATKKINDLQKVLASVKKENTSLVSTLKNLEAQTEEKDSLIVELQRKEELRFRELAKLQASLEEYAEENKTLTNQLKQIEEQLIEQKDKTQHHLEVSEIYKDEVKILRETIKKSDKRKTRNSLPTVCAIGTFSKSPKKSSLPKITPFKNMYHPSVFDREIFNSPLFLRQLSSPISPDGLDTPTPKNIKIQATSPEASPTFELASIDMKQSSLSENSDAKDQVGLMENNLSGVIEDSFDLSADSEFESLKEQNLLSELQACSFLNNCNNCFVDDEDASNIIREHENCPKLFQEYKEQIEMFTKNLEIAAIEHDNLLAQYQNMEKEILEKTNLKNQQLSQEISDLKQQLDCFNDKLNEREKELIEMRNFEIKYNEISEEIRKIKNEQEKEYLEYENLQKKHEILIHEKETLQKLLEEIKAESNILTAKLNDSNNTLASKDKEICSISLQKALLEQEIINLQNEQEKNSREIESFTEKLKYYNDIGKKNVETVKIKILDLDTKVQFLKALADKSSQFIEDLRGENNMIKNKLRLFQPSEDSSSTDDSRSERPIFNKKTKKRTDHELQFKINKYEDHINFLERKLSTEKLKLSRIVDLESRIEDMERERINFEDEKRDILMKLKEAQDELLCKEESCEKMKRQIDSLNLENEKMVENENKLRQKIETLEKDLLECRKEKNKLSVKVEKQKSKVTVLLETKSDIERLSKEAKSVRSLVHEKDSLIQFKNNQLMKSNSSLELAEKRVLNLELLLSKANMVLTGTATNVFRATKMAYESWKCFLEHNSNKQLIEDLETLDIEDKTSSDLTEEDIWNVHNQLNVTSQLLETLANRDKYGLSSKNISKFTMKNELCRYPSRDPDISSSIKEEDTSASIDDDITETIHEMVPVNPSDSTLSHRGKIRVHMLREPQDRSDVNGSTDCKSLIIRTNRPENRGKKMSFLVIIGALFLIGVALIVLQLECIRRARASTCPIDTLFKFTLMDKPSPH